MKQILRAFARRMPSSFNSSPFVSETIESAGSVDPAKPGIPKGPSPSIPENKTNPNPSSAPKVAKDASQPMPNEKTNSDSISEPEVPIDTSQSIPEDKTNQDTMAEPTKVWMASRGVYIQSLPAALFGPAKAIFSQFSSETVRKWGAKLGQSYTNINSVEKPTDIRKIQPFATSVKALDDETKTPQSRGFYKLPNDSLADNLKDIIKLQQSEESEQKLPYQKEHAIGYAHTRMPSTYASVYRILHEIKHRLPDFSPRNCIDYGSGTGAASWAACEIFPDIEVIAIEPSKEMRTVGKKLSVKQPQIKWAESLANLPSIANNEGLYDLVICGYVLSEIENPVTRNLILDALWQRTKGVLVFVEAGTPKGFRLIYSIREWCLKTMNRSESTIVAPCPHEGECPLAAHPKSWCHFSQFTAKFPKHVITLSKGERNFANEKFSYIAVQRGPNARYLSANEELNLAQESFLWPRLVRPTIRRTKHVVFDVCRLNKLERIVLSKGKAMRNVYKFIRKAEWGDLWPFKEGEYFDTEKQKLKYKKYRLKRKLKGKSRSMNEKGESEDTDIEKEKENIKKSKKIEIKEDSSSQKPEKTFDDFKKVKSLKAQSERVQKSDSKVKKISKDSSSKKNLEKSNTQNPEKLGGRKSKKQQILEKSRKKPDNSIDKNNDQ